MPVYAKDTLMEETRRLAMAYRETTQQALPVSNELGRYDAIRLLDIEPTEEMGIDGIFNGKKVQIKSRVIFDTSKSGHRIGQLNLDGNWENLLLVLLNDEYQCTEIYQITKSALLELDNLDKNKRGAMSISKFKAISQQIWPQ